MNLYLLTQEEVTGYDTFTSALVAAESVKEAKLIHPRSNYEDDPWEYADYVWCKTPKSVKAQLIGMAAANIDHGIVMTSFRAG